MVFLKSLTAYGFKSFAKTTKITFDHQMVGVVGPNGSGKSNINDAIRWVLGEQSNKSLRTENAQEIIFQGSREHPKLNMAEVKLVFDNKKRILPIDFDEVEIIRRIYRDSNESEYTINKVKVRLKDIIELVLGTGLSKTSLAIINQGNVANFAQAKSEERRVLFEEAANVSKYKKRKLEALRKLEKLELNLVRISDIVNVLEKSIVFLKKQALKAKVYLEKKELLQKIEVAFLINDISKSSLKLEKLMSDLKDIQESNEEINFTITNAEVTSNSFENKIFEIDSKIQLLTKEFDVVFNKLDLLQNEKLAWKQDTNQNKASLIKELLNEHYILQSEVKQQQTVIVSQTKDISDLKQQRILLTEKLDTTVKNYHALSKDIYELKSKIERLSPNDNSNYFHGVKIILNNANNLAGIIGTVGQLFSVKTRYQLAIEEALSNRMQYIVTTSDSNALQALDFLKRNQAGIATFLPLNTLKPNVMNHDDLNLLQSQKGFIGIASDLIKIDVKYEIVAKFLLGRIIIVDHLKTAKDISHLTYQKYHIISLEGDVIKAGGTITGGYKKLKTSFLKDEAQIKVLEENLVNYEKLKTQCYQEWQELKVKLTTLNHELEQKQLYLGKMQQSYQNNEQKAYNISKQYEQITNKKITSDDKTEQDLNNETQISQLKLKRFQISEQLELQRSLRESYRQQLGDITKSIKEWRNNYLEQQSKCNQLQIEKVKQEINLKTNLERLANNYRMTYEHAVEKYGNKELPKIDEIRNQIVLLRKELEAIGSVNIDAIEEYETTNTRYEFLKGQQQELENGQKQLLGAIKDLDQIVIQQFDQTIKDINKVLPETFNVLFSGGNAKLVYTNPENILETGIDIIVNLPGKIITNLNLLSGGEKSLVALSVLFAILKARPLPLVILDEVEAPLDVANVERFAKYLKSFTQDTQFIIITHRPGTMENCDALYGTTMQIKGVTKMVMIRLEESDYYQQANHS